MPGKAHETVSRGYLSHAHAHGDDDLPGRRPLTFAVILDRDLVGLDRTSALQRFLAGRAAREGRRLRLRVQLRSFDAVCLMVKARAGIGIVPETTARRNARTMAISLVPLADDWALRDLRICIRESAALSGSARRLVEYLGNTAEHIIEDQVAR